jgi:hypothetical protein
MQNRKSMFVMTGAVMIAISYAMNVPNAVFAQQASMDQQTPHEGERYNATSTNSSGNTSESNNDTSVMANGNEITSQSQRLHALLDATVMSIKNNDTKSTLANLSQLLQGLFLMTSPEGANQTTTIGNSTMLSNHLHHPLQTANRHVQGQIQQLTIRVLLQTIPSAPSPKIDHMLLSRQNELL